MRLPENIDADPEGSRYRIFLDAEVPGVRRGTYLKGTRAIAIARRCLTRREP